jgi:hypothetical protein
MAYKVLCEEHLVFLQSDQTEGGSGWSSDA